MARKGEKLSEEYKRKIGEGNRGKKHPHSEEAKQKIREANKKMVFTEEHRRKISEAMKGRTLSDEHKEKLKIAHTGKVLSEEHKAKLKGKPVRKGIPQSEETRLKISNLNSGDNSPTWKGGVTKANIPLYDTYSHRLASVEEIRRSPENPNWLQARCTYCGRWFQPTTQAVRHRISEIENGNSGGRFYCSDGCKSSCSIYKRSKYPKDFKPATSREVHPELRKMVFERDDFTCQKCGSTEKLHCHHIDPVAQNPLESADVDSCVTLCKGCHKQAHEATGCRYSDLHCKGKKEIINDRPICIAS